MRYILLSAVVVVVLFVLLGFTRHVDDRGRTTVTFKLNKKQLLSFLGLAILLFEMFTIVPANHVGIKFSVFGGVNENTLGEGFQLKSPFDQIYIISSEVQTVAIQDVTGQTIDAQWVNMDLDVKYRVNPKNSFIVFKNFRTLDAVNNQLIVPTTQRAIEQITTQYNVIDVLGEKRNEVYIQIEEELERKLSESGIDFFSLTLTDTDAGESIEQAIEAEAIAKKQVETAQQALEKAKVEAETKKIDAQAAADVRLIAAKAEADANNLISNSVTEQVLKKMEMEARLKHGWVEVNSTGGTIVQQP